MEAIILYSPFPTLEAAEHAARQLLTKKLVACCNILPTSTSLYWWEGKLAQAHETLLLAKTTAPLAASAAAMLETLHPYECPAVLSLQASANQAFADWLDNTLAQK